MVMFLQCSANGFKSAKGGGGYGPRGSKSASGYGSGGSIPASGFGPGGPNLLGHRRSILGVGVMYGLSLLLLLFSALSPGAPVFRSPQKPSLLNSNSTRDTRTFNGETTPHVLELK